MLRVLMCNHITNQPSKFNRFKISKQTNTHRLILLLFLDGYSQTILDGCVCSTPWCRRSSLSDAIARTRCSRWCAFDCARWRSGRKWQAKRPGGCRGRGQNARSREYSANPQHARSTIQTRSATLKLLRVVWFLWLNSCPGICARD